MKRNRESQDCMDEFMIGKIGGKGFGDRAAGELLDSPSWDAGKKAWSRPQATGGHFWARCGGKLQK